MCNILSRLDNLELGTKKDKHKQHLVVQQQIREALLDQHDHVQYPTPNSYLKSRIEPLTTTSYGDPRLDYYSHKAYTAIEKFKNNNNCQEEQQKLSQDKNSANSLENNSYAALLSLIEEIKNNQKLDLNIADHNINGLKQSPLKLRDLSEGISYYKGKFELYVLLANADKDKKKGSGVGLLIDKQEKKHIGNIFKPNFNAIIDPDINKASETCETPNKKLLLHNWLNKNNQIWASNNLSLGLLAADIIEIDTLTRSDHDIVLNVIESSILTAAHKNIPKKKITNTNSKGKKLKGLQIPKVDLNALRSLLCKINKELDLNITLQSEYWSDEVLDNLKAELEQARIKIINDRISESKIKIDQLLTRDKKARHLWTEQDDINTRQKIFSRTISVKKAQTDTYLLRTRTIGMNPNHKLNQNGSTI
ncbi:25221_t:CDS:2 [Gigaspora margarita]|uniref:25221_t:CDS:1 n=1 Tax=Gigaspora margarita TaxID=4874 RepID=A0ABN7VAV9_GIGMA|nr:25221_t:CDS:2 [Gigaspora margarita]